MFFWISFSCRNWWKRSYWQRPYFWGKKNRDSRKKLGCKFIRINTSKHYDEDYEIGRIQTFISKFKNRQLKKLEKKSNKKLKELEDKRKIKTSIDKSNHSVKSKCLKWIVKKILPNNKEWKTHNQQ